MNRTPVLAASILSFAALACSGESSTPDAGPMPDSGPNNAVFSVNTYPDTTNASTVTLSGTKPSGNGIYVDGAQRISPNASTTWSMELALNPGLNMFLIQPIDGGGTLGTGTTVSVTRNVDDSTPPTVTDVAPADNSTDVSLNANVTVTFSEPINCATVANTTLIVSAGSQVAGNVACQQGATQGTIRFTPSANLPSDTLCSVTVLAEVADLSGNRLIAPFTSSFTTGAQIDTTPPVDPTITAPDPIPTMTFDATLTVSGGKEPGANVEASWTLDGAPQSNFSPVVAVNASPTWTYDFPLLNGVNVYTLRSVDAAGNESCTDNCTVSFAITKEQMQQQVNAPTVSFIQNTDASRQVISGSKDSNTAITVDGTVVVPRNNATTWAAQLSYGPGTTTFQVRAQDQFGNDSTPVDVPITYTEGPVAPASGEVRVQLNLRDMWNYIGDEFRITQCVVEVSVFEVLIWIEGPLAYDDNGTPTEQSDDVIEPCAYDGQAFERRFTRYVRTVSRTLEENQYELWLYPNYAVANWFAALVESGQWASAPNAIPVDVDRRNASGNMFYDREPPCNAYYSFDGSRCVHNAMAPGAPPIDGMTRATTRPPLDRNTGMLAGGAPMGSWSQDVTFSWDLTDRNGQRVREGAYLVNVLVVADRSDPSEQGVGGIADDGSAAVSPYQWNDVLATDRETCWDNPAHNTVGAHRAEGVVIVDGTNSRTYYWPEKGAPETVDAPHNPREGIRFNGQCDWDGTPDAFCQPGSVADDFASAPDCPAPNSAIGQQVRYLNTPAGWSDPVRVEYCPGGC